MTLVLAVDVGQTGIRASRGEEVIEREGGVLPLTDDNRVIALVERIEDLASELGDMDVLGVGYSGFVEGSPAAVTLAQTLLRRVAVRAVVVAADAVTAHLGTVGLHAGTTIICGTGVAALGSDGAGHWKRIDARGYLLGDFGSGFWIGQRGIQAALDALEGRGKRTMLVEASRQLGSPADIYQASMASVPPPRYLAGFAPSVLSSAEQGDEVSRAIVAEAADHLARSIDAAHIADGPVGLTGGLMRSKVLVDELAAALETRHGRASDLIVIPDAAIQGARLLAEHYESAQSIFPGLIAVEETND